MVHHETRLHVFSFKRRICNRSEVNHVMTIIISIQDCLLYYKFPLSFVEGLSSFNIVAVITYLNVN